MIIYSLGENVKNVVIHNKKKKLFMSVTYAFIFFLRSATYYYIFLKK